MARPWYNAAMYPSTPIEEALQCVIRKLEASPSPLGLSAECIGKGLKLCLQCNCVRFGDRFFVPCRGCAQGACHSCDFTDIWIGDITEKHITTCPVDTEHFSVYRDDTLDLLHSEDNLEVYKQHLATLHPNLEFVTRSGKEGEYLDLWLMVKDKKSRNL